MTISLPDVLDCFRQPEYTGKNRCTPCTGLNVVIAALGSLVRSVVLTPFVGFLAFAIGLTKTSLRGNLYPGTPEFTKQYLADWLLAWFDEAPDRLQASVIARDDLDPETLETVA